MSTQPEFEFDSSIGNQSQKEDDKMKQENKHFTTLKSNLFGINKIVEEVLKGIDGLDLPEKAVSKVEARVCSLLKVKGVDVTDEKAVKTYMFNNVGELAAIIEDVLNVKDAAQPCATLAGPAHDRFLEAMKKVDMYSDAHIYGVLHAFQAKGGEDKDFAKKVFDEFNNDRAAFGQYFRDVMGIKAPSSSFMKTTAYVTADGFRASGDLFETIITATAKAINKYGFHLVAKGIDGLAGGRPEVLDGHNYAKDLGQQIWKKISPKSKEVRPENKPDTQL